MILWFQQVRCQLFVNFALLLIGKMNERSEGKVKLEEKILPPVEPLYCLLSCNLPKSKLFMRNIRRYNNVFQITEWAGKQFDKRDIALRSRDDGLQKNI